MFSTWRRQNIKKIDAGGHPPAQITPRTDEFSAPGSASLLRNSGRTGGGPVEIMFFVEILIKYLSDRKKLFDDPSQFVQEKQFGEKILILRQLVVEIWPV